MVNAFIPSENTDLSAETLALIARRERALGPAYRLFYEEPVHLVKGSGVWLEDAQGQRYLDVYNNVASVGHCHPRVVAAMAEQAARLNTHTRYLHETILAYAERLLATFPGDERNAMFTCTGSEANDLALRIARARTGARGVIVTRLAYHGVTTAVSEISPSLGAHVALGEHVRTVSAPNGYGQDPAAVGPAFAAEVRAAMADLQRCGFGVAALVCDTVFSSDGVFTDPPGFLAEAVEAVQAAGGLFIADEVQPGFGRTGEAMWGYLRHGVSPDIVSIGKPMGNGYPIAGIVVKREVVAEFGRKARYFNTFGGSPVACATGLAVLDVIRDEGLMANAQATGNLLQAGLRSLAARHPSIGDVRGAGLFVAAELVKDRATRQPDAALTTRVVNGLRRKRVLISATGPGANVLKIRPPLVFGPAHAEHFLDALSEVMDEVG